MVVDMPVRHAEIGLVAPFRYTSLIWAVLAGYIVFGTVPDVWVIVGAGIVVASGLYILHREGRLGRRHSVSDRPESAPPDDARR